jgi:hypothetical protein
LSRINVFSGLTKKIRLFICCFVSIIILFSAISCNSTPEQEDDSDIITSIGEEAAELDEAPDVSFIEEPAPFIDESSFYLDVPDFSELMDEAEDHQISELPVPMIDLPEIIFPLASPTAGVEPPLQEPLPSVSSAPEPAPAASPAEVLPAPLPQPVVPEPPRQADPVRPTEPARQPEPVQPQSQPVRPIEPVRQPEPARPPEPPSNLRQVEPEIPPPVQETASPPEPLPELPARTPPAAQEEDVVFSRVVRAIVGQLVEIPFRGTGWVYLGELSSRRGISYDSRRLDTEGQSFVFRAEEPGTYALKFYRQDFIRNYILNDHVQVIIGQAPESSGIGWFNAPFDRGRAIAEPRWPLVDGFSEPANVQAVPPASQAPTNAASAPANPTTATTPASPASTSASPATASASQPVSQATVSPNAQASATQAPATGTGGLAATGTQTPQSGLTAAEVQGSFSGMMPAEYIRRARQEYDAGRVESGLSILDNFSVEYPSGTDEALWLYGQLLEANSPSRDIRLALEYYRRLVREFPQSPLADEAQRRIAYLERYYFNIR